MRRAPEDDLEVVPVDAHTIYLPPADAPPAGPARPRRLAVVAVALVAVAAAAVAVDARRNRDDPRADTRTLVTAWARVLDVADVANHAAVRVRILVATIDTGTVFRGLAAVRAEERDRLRAIARRVDRVESGEADVVRARSAITRALALRERRARLASTFYASGGEGIRNFEAIERGIATTSREVTGALARIQERYGVPTPADTATDLQSSALGRSLGALARVVDVPVGSRLLVNVDGRLYELEPDAGPSGRVRVISDRPSLRTLATLDDGTVVAWGADSEVRVVARPGKAPAPEPAIGYGRPLPSSRADALWVATGNLTTEISLEGVTLAGPHRQPRDQVVAAVSTGLVVFEPRVKAPADIGIWSPPDPTIDPVPGGYFVAARGDHVVTSACGPSGCALLITDVRDGTTRTVPTPDGWSHGGGAISPDGRWLALSMRDEVPGIAFVDVVSLRHRLVRVEVGSRAQSFGEGLDLTWHPDSSRVFVTFERSGDGAWAEPESGPLHRIRFQVAFDRVVRVRDLAVVPA